MNLTLKGKEGGLDGGNLGSNSTLLSGKHFAGESRQGLHETIHNRPREGRLVLVGVIERSTSVGHPRLITFFFVIALSMVNIALKVE
jgi:hypothetical protein